METFDYKKAYKDLYILKTKPMMIQVPSMNFCDGQRKWQSK